MNGIVYAQMAHTLSILTVILFLIIPAFSILWIYIATRVVCNAWLSEKRRIYLKQKDPQVKVTHVSKSASNVQND